MSNTQEIVQRLEREIADRSAAVEEVDAFKNQLARAIKAFMAADEAVRGLNDHDSEIDTKIAAAIDEHLEQSTDCAASASTVDSARSIP